MACALVACERGGAPSDPPSRSDEVTEEQVGPDLSNRPLPPTVEPVVRVRAGSYESDLIEDRGFLLGESGERLLVFDRVLRRPRILDAPVRVDRTRDAWSIRGAGAEVAVPGEGPLSIRLLGESPSGLSIDDVRLPGVIDLIPTTDGVDLVARLPMETYLSGVVEGELFQGWPRATYQAQAVAARSYAVAESAFWGDRRHYDVVAGPASQAWIGLETSDRAREAVESTRGVVLLFKDRIVPAYYSSCCGGRSAAASDAISDRRSHRIRPLDARADDSTVCCEDAVVRDWTATFSRDQLASALRALGRKRSVENLERFRSLRSITLTGTNDAGRALRFRLEDDTGRIVRLDARSLRGVLNALPRSDGSDRRPLRSDDFEVQLRGNEVRLKGRGYGHGVGLCQYGARAMAEEGADWEEIISRYYPGAVTRSAWPDLVDRGS